jgi:hypothetical protein
MKNTDRLHYESLANVLALCIEHRAELEQTPLGKELVAQLDTRVNAAGASFNQQSDGRTSAHVATRDRRRAVKKLRRTVDATIRVGRALDRKAGVQRDFPRLRNGNHRQLMADATAIHDALEGHADALAANRLPLDDLSQQIADVETAIRAQGAARETHVAARETAEDELRAGALAADALEPLFFKAMENNSYAIAQWKNARRIGPRRAQTPAPTQPASATAAEPNPTATKTA